MFFFLLPTVPFRTSSKNREHVGRRSLRRVETFVHHEDQGLRPCQAVRGHSPHGGLGGGGLREGEQAQQHRGSVRRDTRRSHERGEWIHINLCHRLS